MKLLARPGADARLWPSLALMAVGLLAGCPASSTAQYFFNGAESLADSVSSLAVGKVSFPIRFEDAAWSGMGKIVLMDIGGRSPYEKNPALLARPSGFSGSFWMDAGSPLETLDAIVFITENEGEFESGSSAKLVDDAIRRYIQDPSVKPDIGAAVERLLDIPRQMVTKVVGDISDPRINNADLSVNLKARLGHWGFQLSGMARTGFAIQMGPVYRELLDILLTTNFADSSSLDYALARLQGLGDQIVDPVTGVVSREALPAIYSLNYADLVASVGYGFSPLEKLDVGITARILNRRYAVDRVSVTETSHLAQRWLAALKSGSTHFTVDLGGIYTLSPKFQVAATLHNLIPGGRLTSSYSMDFLRVQVLRDGDSTGQPVVNADGDTALVVARQKVLVEGPVELSLPFVADAGVVYRAMDNLDFVFELTDIAGQQTRFQTYLERIRFGAEYRFRFLEGAVVVPLRMGLAEMIPTFGIGIGYKDIVRLDGGYYTSSTQRNRTIGVQITANW